MKLWIIATAALLGAPALAQDIDCAKAMTQTDMNICADRDYQAADKKLNATYAELRSTLDDASKGKLKTAQRSWIGFRDAECTFETASSEGGSIHPMEYSGCLTRLTKERSKTIEALTVCQKDAEKCGL